MKKCIIILLIAALSVCALVSCKEDKDISVDESSSAAEQSAPESVTESSVADESSEAPESETVSEESKEPTGEEIDVTISIEYASDALLADKDSYILYDEPDEDFSKIAFTTDTEVKNFRYFSIISTDTWSDDGAPKVDTVLYTLESFTPDMIFVAEAVFADVYAIRGISFEDANGNIQYYSLYDSAVDDTIGLQKSDIAE